MLLEAGHPVLEQVLQLVEALEHLLGLVGEPVSTAADEGETFGELGA